jgi:hypothetical protein
MADYLKDDTVWNYSRGLYSGECECCGGEFVPLEPGLSQCTLCGGAKDKTSEPRFGKKRSFDHDHQYKGCGHIERLRIVEGMLDRPSISDARAAHEATFTASVQCEQMTERIIAELNAANELREQLLKERTSLRRGRKKQQAELLQPSIEFAEKAILDCTVLLEAALKLKSAVETALAQGAELKKIVGA